MLTRPTTREEKRERGREGGRSECVEVWMCARGALVVDPLNGDGQAEGANQKSEIRRTKDED